MLVQKVYGRLLLREHITLHTMVRHKAVPVKHASSPSKSQNENGKERKKPRWRPGTVALRQIKKYQRSTDLLIPKLPMERLIKEESKHTALEGGVKWKKEAIEALHVATEDFLTEHFQNMNNLAIARNAKTIAPRDWKTLRALSTSL